MRGGVRCEVGGGSGQGTILKFGAEEQRARGQFCKIFDELMKVPVK